MIKHIWFDFSDTIASIHKEIHHELLYKTFAKIKNQPLTLELVDEFKKLRQEHKSNSGVFYALGKPAGFWSELIHTLDPRKSYALVDSNSPEVLKNLKNILPISIFSNMDLDKILPAVDIDPKLFTHILSGRMVGKPKPALEGFYKMIELSNLKPEEIFYIGDSIGKDIIPAKSVGVKTGFVFGEAKEADYSFKDFQDIFEFVKSQNEELS